MIAPLTPSVAHLPCGRRGLTPSDSAAKTRQDWLCPPPRQRRRSSPVQSAFQSRRARRRSLSRCIAARRRCLPASTIREHSPRSPETLALAVALSPRDDWPSGAFTPSDPRRSCQVAWASSRGHASRASTCAGARFRGLCRMGRGSACAVPFTGPGPDRLAPHRCRLPRDPRRGAREGHVPDPLGSDTFCRELEAPSAGEADSAGRLRAVVGRLRALVELTGAWRPARQRRWPPHPWRACFREARCRSPCSRRPRGFEDRLSRASAKRPAIRGFQGVFPP